MLLWIVGYIGNSSACTYFCCAISGTVVSVDEFGEYMYLVLTCVFKWTLCVVGVEAGNSGVNLQSLLVVVVFCSLYLAKIALHQSQVSK